MTDPVSFPALRTGAASTTCVARRNDSGVALLIVLTIVALLTISVVEFTYSVQLDQHRARNSLNALQARLLARSGMNLAEAFLARDEEERYDAFNEPWALLLAEFCNGIPLEGTTLVRCNVEDESGKININNTRPRRASSAAAAAQAQDRPTADAYLRDAIEYIMNLNSVSVTEIGDQLRDYWDQVPLGNEENEHARMPDFGSLEDFVAQFRIPTDKLARLRRSLTAQPTNRLSKININTAPEDVLRAVIIGYGDSGEEVVQEILARRLEDPPFDSAGAISPVLGDLDEDRRAAVTQLFDVRSSYFRLQASALTNTDPSGEGTSGIGQTLTALVRRTRAQNISGRAPVEGQAILWTFRLMDWQREAGARLFRERPGEDLEGEDLEDELEEEGDPNFRSK